jgi:threonine synthase
VSGTGSGERDAEIVREALSHRSGYWEVHEALAALARIESEVARLQELVTERQVSLVKQWRERAEATEKANRALGARNSELLAKLARLTEEREVACSWAAELAGEKQRLERIAKAADKFGDLDPELHAALAAEEGGDRE